MPILTIRAISYGWMGGPTLNVGKLCFKHKSCASNQSVDYLRVIPQRTVDNNLGPDRLAGLKALDPNYSRQKTL